MCKVSKICVYVCVQMRDIQQTDLLSKPNEKIVNISKLIKYKTICLVEVSKVDEIL